jgi:hypothetical protein
MNVESTLRLIHSINAMKALQGRKSVLPMQNDWFTLTA